MRQQIVGISALLRLSFPSRFRHPGQELFGVQNKLLGGEMARATRSSASAATASKPAKKQQLSSPPATPQRENRRSTRATASATPASSRKRTRNGENVAVKKEEPEDDELPHNLGTKMPPTPEEDDQRTPKRAKRSRVKKEEQPADEDAVVKDEFEQEVVSAKTTPKKKTNYGLTPGVSPYPDYPHPTPEECAEVARLLSKVHGKVVAPKAIPPPSLDVSGCGEVPSVLDALVRTRLSANTTNKNSSTAFQGLVSRFGVLKDGIGKGSVDWDAVRRAPQREVFLAIQRGGLADRKSKDIQAILQMAYEENQERRKALASSKPTDGAENESKEEKDEEISKAEKNIISLDHLHLLSTDDAINKMLTYPGIGPKTASCVALFCLQRPSFAVDTHVFRICQYLGWVPPASKVKKGQPKVDRNTTYSHCDVRIPDDLKYPLHALLIKHGKTCPRCRAVTGQSSAGWEKGCPIEHLVKRHGARKGGVSVKDRKTAKAAAVEDDDDGIVDDGEGEDEEEEDKWDGDSQGSDEPEASESEVEEDEE